MRDAGETGEDDWQDLLRLTCAVLRHTPADMVSAISVTASAASAAELPRLLALLTRRLEEEHGVAVSAERLGDALTVRFERRRRRPAAL